MAGTSGLTIRHYDWAGGREAMLRFGPDRGPVVVAALPFFEEANRTRAAMVDVLRRLAARGIRAVLPDLPGTNESLLPTSDATLAMWREAFASACAHVGGPVHSMAWRAGALVDGEADVASRWYLAPQTCDGVVRELRRLRRSGGGDDAGGNEVSDVMFAQLAGAQPTTSGAMRVVRLESDPRAADRKLPGAPLWRAAEPTSNADLQALIAEDVAGWIAGTGE